VTHGRLRKRLTCPETDRTKGLAALREIIFRAAILLTPALVHDDPHVATPPAASPGHAVRNTLVTWNLIMQDGATSGVVRRAPLASSAPKGRSSNQHLGHLPPATGPARIRLALTTRTNCLRGAGQRSVNWTISSRCMTFFGGSPSCSGAETARLTQAGRPRLRKTLWC